MCERIPNLLCKLSHQAFLPTTHPVPEHFNDFPCSYCHHQILWKKVSCISSAVCALIPYGTYAFAWLFLSTNYENRAAPLSGVTWNFVSQKAWKNVFKSGHSSSLTYNRPLWTEILTNWPSYEHIDRQVLTICGLRFFKCWLPQHILKIRFLHDLFRGLNAGVVTHYKNMFTERSKKLNLFYESGSIKQQGIESSTMRLTSILLIKIEF